MRIPPALALSVVVLYAFGYPLGALGIAAMSPFLLLFLRFAISGALMLALVRATGRRLPRGVELGHATVVGLLTQATQFLGCYLGLQAGVPAGVAALIIGVNPAVTTVVARLALRERLTPRRALAATLGLAAVVAACWSTVPALAHAGAGIGFTLLGLVGIAVGGVYHQRFCRGVDPLAGNAVGMAVAAIPAGVLVAVFGATVVRPIQGVVVLVLMVLLSSMTATTLYLRVIGIAGAGGAAMLFAVIPSVSALFAFLLLGEPVQPGAIAGLALGGAACAIASLGGRRTPARDLSVGEPALREGSGVRSGA
ncbi:DMT family transporter [Tsukamurella paurometabola]|uniref:DMT family transporter n=1 Tax=Tsukamurella paurometabola TaxID=2061 RepID=A0A3P8KVC1_TSUPA|nr:DMT family transporter [Tsukamurella paurometabola]MBS4100513.1 DMT family transporter [Tsukamurella paurometabola]UEA83969.1 DMT family transporter [Tsukamurella paurometabola]VDR41127.1 putative DMT superfamily transporter inner membrane protein [Tsukamurella paurometabola]